MEDLEVCSFVKCKLGRGNLLVGLRDNDVTRLNHHIDFRGFFWKVKVGDKVCAIHYTPCPGQQLKHAMKTGHVEPEAELGLIHKQYINKWNKEKRLAKKEKNLQLEKERLQVEKKEEAVSSVIQPCVPPMEGNSRYMHCF